MVLSAELELLVGSSLTTVERVHKCRFVAESRMLAFQHNHNAQLYSAVDTDRHAGFAAHQRQLLDDSRQLNLEIKLLERVSISMPLLR
jgi:hypothetical protein